MTDDVKRDDPVSRSGEAREIEAGKAEEAERVATPEASRPGMGRRSFLQRTGAAAIGLGALGLGRGAMAASSESDAPRIKRYVKLGKTGLEISDIGFGSGGCRTADLVSYCYDRGQNYFDTAEMYRSEGWAKGDYVENLIGKALQGKRDKVVITTKYEAAADDSRAHIMSKLEAALRRLRTDYVDVFMNHAVNELARLQNPEWSEFVELAKKQGKMRFAGMSGHGGNLQECLDYALDNDMVDVILCSHNFGSDPAFYEKFTKHFDFVANQKGLPRLFAKAKKKGVGVIVMKTMMGAKINDLSKYQTDGADHQRAAFRWVFSDPNVDALIISMKNKDLADKYMACSGDREFQKADADVLRRYVAEHSSEYCRNECSECQSSCPNGVPIADVLRQRMYSKSYENHRMAAQGYARLGSGASACLDCQDEPCKDACPYDLDIPKLTRETARIIS